MDRLNRGLQIERRLDQPALNNIMQLEQILWLKKIQPWACEILPKQIQVNLALTSKHLPYVPRNKNNVDVR